MELMMSLALKAIGRQDAPFVWFWPGRHTWSAVLTHDVEGAGGLANVRNVAALEDRFGLRSSFNFVPRDYEVPGSLLQELREGGYEIGVHGLTHDGLMFTDWAKFLDRVGEVNDVGRQWGACGFRSPATFRNLEWLHLLGFEYDSSVSDSAPFEPQPGGCATLFPYRLDTLVEVPMTVVQDHTLFGVLQHRDASMWMRKLATIRAAHGMACVLTHPDPGEGYIGRDPNGSRYEELLSFVAESDAWTPLARDLVRWWDARSSLAWGRDGLDGAGTALAVLDERGLVVVPPSETEGEPIPFVPHEVASDAG
jgi:hypothetical protein